MQAISEQIEFEQTARIRMREIDIRSNYEEAENADDPEGYPVRHLLVARQVVERDDARAASDIGRRDDQWTDHVVGEDRCGLAFGYEVRDDRLHEEEAEQHGDLQAYLLARVRRQEHREETDQRHHEHGHQQVTHEVTCSIALSCYFSYFLFFIRNI